jgi:hypothetical protein
MTHLGLQCGVKAFSLGSRGFAVKTKAIQHAGPSDDLVENAVPIERYAVQSQVNRSVFREP